ncbi:MAG: type II toxin-antitoxin system Phd/YefM family antitoxin [Gammaproteobacteria bacterium]|nr:type II toxin-antitoxin system Phd/YefM family antitoxin [Gammaproteobacteria bacterium]
MPASKVSKEFGRFLDTIQREPVLVTKKNRPVAVTLSIQDAETLLQMQTEVGIKQGLADIGAGRFNEFTPTLAKNGLITATQSWHTALSTDPPLPAFR